MRSYPVPTHYLNDVTFIIQLGDAVYIQFWPIIVSTQLGLNPLHPYLLKKYLENFEEREILHVWLILRHKGLGD